MWPYIAIFCVLLGGVLLEPFKRLRQVRPAMAIGSTVLLILFAGLRRPGVGADDDNYLAVFWNVPDLSAWLSGRWTYAYQEFWMEPGYVLLNSLLRIFSDNGQVLFLVCAALSVGGACKYFYKMTDRFHLAAILFFSHNFLYRDINQIRAAIAAVFVLMAVWLVAKGLHRRAALAVLVATSFHMGAAIIAVPLFLSQFELRRSYVAVSLGVAYVVGAGEMTMTLLGMLPELGLLTEKIADYSDSDYVDVINLFDATNLKNTVIVIGFLCYWDKLKERGMLFNIIAWSMVIGTCWRIAFFDFGIMAGRVATFLTVVEVIAVSNFLSVVKKKRLVTLLIVVYAMLMLYLNLFVKVGRFPYQIGFT